MDPIHGFLHYDFKVTEHSFDENYKICLIATIFAEDAVFAGVHVLD